VPATVRNLAAPSATGADLPANALLILSAAPVGGVRDANAGNVSPFPERLVFPGRDFSFAELGIRPAASPLSGQSGTAEADSPPPLPGDAADSGSETFFEKVLKKLERVWQQLSREIRSGLDEEERPDGPADGPTSLGDEPLSPDSRSREVLLSRAPDPDVEVPPGARPDDVWGSLESGWTWSDSLPDLGALASAAGCPGAGADGADGAAGGGGDD
jgi:hypothetical protein